jgi:hypothetical protein
MKTQIVIMSVMLLCLQPGMTAETRKYLHDDARINAEFDAIYRAIAKAMINNYVYREGAVGYDYEGADFTCDGAWHDLDLSAIVPNTAKAIVLQIVFHNGTTANAECDFRKNGAADDYNNTRLLAQVSPLNFGATIIVPCDENQVIEYYMTANNVTYLTVAGWIN